MPWEASALSLADTVTGRGSLWREAVAHTPRHRLIPFWWDTPYGAQFGKWERIDGPVDDAAWLAAAYSDQTLITQVNGQHADLVARGQHVEGLPTSSATLPSLVVRMLQYADVHPDADVLDVATGSGYSAALLSHLLGSQRVTSLDVDPYLVDVARERLADIGHRPVLVTQDARGELPGTYDCIVSMVGIRPIPASWLTALRPGGRLATVVGGTSLILTAKKDDRGGAVGRIEWDRAMFMGTRSGPGSYPPRADRPSASVGDGDAVTTSPLPVVFASDAWDLAAMLEISTPGIQHDFDQADNGIRTAYMWHGDGSWARAVSRPEGGAVVHQGGPQRLWDHLDDIRRYWLEHGELPVRGAKAIVRPDGRILLSRGDWKAVIR
ncbi:methyltransferase domain-containing protein [Nonomuraea sp. NPDC050556]|uniref:methyltransferase domain-containing protein n=1 Tax=Nonomuraea sp. NPDC050556 TaxID=3364369 RepID=UPI00379C4E65